MQRRKTLVNGIMNSGILNDKQKITKILEEIGLEANIRGEKLTLQEFADLANSIYKTISKI